MALQLDASRVIFGGAPAAASRTAGWGTRFSMLGSRFFAPQHAEDYEDPDWIREKSEEMEGRAATYRSTADVRAP